MILPNKNHRSGISLIEVAIASLLVGGVVAGSLSLLGASLRTQAAANDATKAPMLAHMLMAEIISLPYIDPEGEGTSGPETGESVGNRTQFDDIDDYHGWSSSPPRGRSGGALPDYTGWTRAANVYWAEQMLGNGWMWDTGIKRVNVTVTSPEGVQTKIIAYRSEDGALEQPPTVDKTVITHISSSITLGSMSAAVQGSVNLLNHAEDPNAN